MEQEEDKFVFVINHESEHTGVSLSLDLEWEAEVIDMVTKEQWQTGERLEKVWNLEPQEVKILYCKKK